MNEKQQAIEDAVLEECLMKLREHFDWVQILVGNYEGGNQETFAVAKGGGDFYARMGKIREWVIYQDELVKEKARQDQLEASEE